MFIDYQYITNYTLLPGGARKVSRNADLFSLLVFWCYRAYSGSISMVFALGNPNRCFMENFTLKSRHDGLDISVIALRPDGEVKAVLQIAHGMCGSKERYIPFMRYMSSRGVACVANDHRGHGASILSSDDLGYMYEGGYEALIDDMHVVHDWIAGEFPGLPVYMLGHSMGSMALRAYMHRFPSDADGIVISGSPAYSPLSPLLYRIASMLCALGLGHTRPKIIYRITTDYYNRHFDSEGSLAWTCSDPEVRREFISNPVHNFRFTLNGSRALMGLMLKAYSHERFDPSMKELPIVFLSGEDDPCMGGPSGLDKAICAIREAGCRNVMVKTYPAMRHEILNEIGKERVWQDIYDFIQV